MQRPQTILGPPGDSGVELHVVDVLSVQSRSGGSNTQKPDDGHESNDATAGHDPCIGCGAGAVQARDAGRQGRAGRAAGIW